MQVSAATYVRALAEALAHAGRQDNAVAMSAYMKGHFRFFGVKSPERKQVLKMHTDKYGWPEAEALKSVCRLCFAEDAPRELQYCTQALLERKISLHGADILELVEELIPLHTWWDSVDFLSPAIAGRILKRHPELICRFPDIWIGHSNFWFQRAALLFQLKWKADTDAERLFTYVRAVAGTREFFLHKASGWALRQYAKFEPEKVRAFIGQQPLPSLTVREGSKYL